MKILAIRLKNLASIEGPYEIDFTREPLNSTGIFAISGPTGAGKSTILDALCLALYDKVPRFASSAESQALSDVGDATINQNDVKNILRRGTGEGYAEVSFLAVDGHRYCSTWSVRRARGKATGALQGQVIKVHDEDTGEELPGTKTELLARLVTLTGLTYDQFTRTVLLAQNDFATFLKSREAAKAELLEKLTGTGIYSQISRTIFQRSKAANDAYNLVKSQLGLIELLPEEELKAMKTRKEELARTVGEAGKQLALLNEKLKTINNLNQQQQLLQQQQSDEQTRQANLLKLNESQTRQQAEFLAFKEQCLAIQPDIRKAREWDVLIKEKDAEYRKAEATLKPQPREVVSQDTPLDVLLKQNQERADRLNAFGISKVAEEQSQLQLRQKQLQATRQNTVEWLRLIDESAKQEKEKALLVENQKRLEEESGSVQKQLAGKQEQVGTLQRLFEQARITMGKDVKDLRANLTPGQPCPVCGSTTHPYCLEQQVETLYRNIEKEYTAATAEFQTLNNRHIALARDLKHNANLQQQAGAKQDALQKEATRRTPQKEEEKQLAFFDNALDGLQKQLDVLKARLYEYQTLYAEWQRETRKAELLRLHLLGEELAALQKKRSGLLKGKSADDAELSIQRSEKTWNDRLEATRKELDTQKNLLASRQGEIKQLMAHIAELTLEKDRIESPEDLPATITSRQQHLQEQERAFSTLDATLIQQEKNLRKSKEIALDAKTKQAACERWEKLNKLIGSADGTKFKVIAQSYTLNLLLMHANKHLSYLSKQYRLQQVPGTLALQVVDKYLCDEVRTVYSLSGGESFLISLALALGLSSLSSNNLKVESLFIDEGFGSLDSDSLRLAMDALEQLQTQGRKIGVISHVQEMSERIPVQVVVRKLANGRSGVGVEG